MNEDKQLPREAPTLFDQYRTSELEPSTQNTELDADEKPQQSPEKPEPGMPLEARRALVLLLRQGVVMASEKRLAFEALCRHENLIIEHLNNMFMRMLVDTKAGMAILLQQENADELEEHADDSSRLINRRTLSLYDTLLLLVLRKYYQERETAGEQRIIIDCERIEALMTPFLPLTYSSRSERRTLNGSLTLLKEKRLISAVRGDDERFEITPVIRYVVNADFLERLLKEYKRLAGKPGVKTDDEVRDA